MAEDNENTLTRKEMFSLLADWAHLVVGAEIVYDVDKKETVQLVFNLKRREVVKET